MGILIIFAYVRVEAHVRYTLVVGMQMQMHACSVVSSRRRRSESEDLKICTVREGVSDVCGNAPAPSLYCKDRASALAPCCLVDFETQVWGRSTRYSSLGHSRSTRRRGMVVSQRGCFTSVSPDCSIGGMPFCLCPYGTRSRIETLG